MNSNCIFHCHNIGGNKLLSLITFLEEYCYIFQDVTLCSLVEVHWLLGQCTAFSFACFLPFLKLETPCFSKTSTNFCETTQHHIQKIVLFTVTHMITSNPTPFLLKDSIDVCNRIECVWTECTIIFLGDIWRKEKVCLAFEQTQYSKRKIRIGIEFSGYCTIQHESYHSPDVFNLFQFPKEHFALL
jgi:hypothetical protein